MIKAVAFVPNTPTLIGDLGVQHIATISALELFGNEISGKIDAAVIMTPHFYTSGSFGIVSTPRLKQIYDFYGFPRNFYEVKYEPPGYPELAEQIINLGVKNGIRIGSVGNWGLDHGAWSPLFHIFRDANVPIVPVSVCPDLGIDAHISLGKLIRSPSIKKNLCILASGSIIHRLDLFQSGNHQTPPATIEYLDLCISSFKEGNWGKIRNASPDLFHAAAPEGDNLQLGFIEGVVGENYNARILANEIEFNAASLTTVVFEEA
jgi:4,5-DOPA dioxygenase extradiol